MAKPAQHAATYADLEAVPPHLVAEILYGRLVTHPRPAPRHSGAASVLGGMLIPPFQLGRGGPGGWILLDEPELHLAEHVVVPDLAGWRRERLSKLPDRAWIDVAPDWVCDVLSPSTEGYDRGEKRSIYAEARVGHLWHVDPVLRMLEAFELRDGKWLLLDVFQDNAEVAVPPFADIAFSLAPLWPFDPAPTEPA
jgi:Uma2 family endonuclease